MPVEPFFTLQKICWEFFDLAAAEAELAQLRTRVNETMGRYRQIQTAVHDRGSKWEKGRDGVLHQVADEDLGAAQAAADSLHNRIERLEFSISVARRHGGTKTEKPASGNGAPGRFGKLFQRGAKT